MLAFIGFVYIGLYSCALVLTGFACVGLCFSGFVCRSVQALCVCVCVCVSLTLVTGFVCVYLFPYPLIMFVLDDYRSSQYCDMRML